MDNIKISITENGTTTLATAGKYCDRNIEVEAKVLSEDDVVFNLTGDCSFMFRNAKWDWVLTKHTDRVVCKDITTATSMFYASGLAKIPITLQFKSNGSGQLNNVEGMFDDMENLTELPRIIGLTPSTVEEMIMRCYRLRSIPEEVYSDWNLEYCTVASGVFCDCHSLRTLPVKLLEKANKITNSGNTWFYKMASKCYSLDEIVDLPIPTNIVATSSMLSDTARYCSRLKRFTFKKNDGQPYVVSWKSQTLDLSASVGYATNANEITGYNSGITYKTRVTTDAEYASLKEDPDWYTTNINYSRYNHDSAVETINSLPDTSAYLAEKGGTNTVKFKGAAGAKTDGGAISNLTEEEIAVAAAKGWTVTLT